MFIAIWIVGLSCSVTYVVTVAFLIALCRPRQKIWNQYLPGQCYDYNANFRASGIFNIISDFAILIIPMPTLLRLQMPLRKKTSIMAVFATGFL